MMRVRIRMMRMRKKDDGDGDMGDEGVDEVNEDVDEDHNGGKDEID